MKDSISIKKANRRHCIQIAQLHEEYLPSGFLSSLGVGFLRLLYESMITAVFAFCLVAEDNGRIVGFISGAVSVSKFYKEFLKKHFLKATITLLPRLIRPSLVKKTFETLCYPHRREGDLPDAELLSVVINEKYRGKGISEMLFKRLVADFLEMNITRFKIVVGSNLLAACRFYKKMGASLDSEIEIHKGDKSRIYTWEHQLVSTGV